MAEKDQGDSEKRLAIMKIYLKDFSFESPLAPQVFKESDWAPQTSLNMRSAHTAVDDKHHEVVLTISVEAKDSEKKKTLFLVELHQAGLFEIGGFSREEFGALIGSFCPNILFPYARESIAGIIQKGGFPEFVLQPINFDALYMQSLQQQQQKGDGTKPETH
ncbi:MAG: protein-export chaperone SecB [Proteobacteria bacterium]|nr:protein-export chaperone SecB [Pseudomonadota bacterium]